MLINYGRKFSKQYDKADLKIKNAFKSKLKLFKEDPYHPLLNNHSFTGEYAGCRSINITGNWRAILSESQDKEGNKETTFRVLGTHPQIIWIKQPLTLKNIWKIKHLAGENYPDLEGDSLLLDTPEMSLSNSSTVTSGFCSK